MARLRIFARDPVHFTEQFFDRHSDKLVVIFNVLISLILVTLSLEFYTGSVAEARDQRKPASCQSTTAQPVAITLSGGVSLGAYQAGSLAYTSLVLKNNSEFFATKVVSGTSAGALNAFLTAVATCEGRSRLPSQSEFYRSWVEFEGEALVANANDRRGLFSKTVFEQNVSRVESLWRKGLPETCDLVLGLSATRVTPMTDGTPLGSARQGEKFAIRIRGRGENRSPLISNFVNPTLYPRPLLLSLKPGDDQQNFKALTSVLFASASFPLAFAPEKIESCLASPKNRWIEEGRAFTCADEEIETSDFVDGGIYDNKPFALTERLVRTGLMETDCGETVWRSVPMDASKDARTAKTAAHLLYFYSDLNSGAKLESGTDVRAGNSEADSSGKLRNGALGVMSVLLDGLLNASRSSDSQALLEQSPELKTQIAPLSNSIPRLGDSLWGFFGFYERDFRDFDFYLGVWEARELFKRDPRLAKRLTNVEFDLKSIDSKKLACLDASFHVAPDRDQICQATENLNFQKLVRLAVARIRANRSDLNFALSYLAGEGYIYRDLGLSASQARQAPAMIKRSAMNSVSELAKRQSFSEGFVVSAAGPLLLNLIEPLPTYRDLAVSFGSQTQITLSTLVDSLETFRPRWTLGLGLENTSSWLGSGGGKVIATPLVGLEFEPASLNSSLLQTRLSLSAGYKFGDASRDSECKAGSRLTRDCTGLSTRLGVSFTIIERLRLQTEVEAMPLQNTAPMPWRVLPTIGLQFYF